MLCMLYFIIQNIRYHPTADEQEASDDVKPVPDYGINTTTNDVKEVALSYDEISD